MGKVKSFLKNEIVLIISFLLALLSMLFVPPSVAYADYIDYRTLALLCSLMAVMAGVNKLGVFSEIARALIKRVKTASGLTFVLVLICFFSSMLITNDVSLITFVPFTIVVLNMADCRNKLIFIVTLETIAANLGSMLTPIGNPQNLYLYSSFNMSITDFFKTIFPYAVLSLAGLIVLSFFAGRKSVELKNSKHERVGDKRLVLMYIALFVFAVLCVFRVLHYAVVLAVVILCVLLFDRDVIRRIDYSLLFTFVFLFVFIGNLGNISEVSTFLRGVVNGNEVLVGVLSSQIISNVPAAILLSGFTDNVSSLLIGVNLGGLGTLIASMASLISFKLMQKEKINIIKYISIFTVLNIMFLAVNILLWHFIC